MTEDLKKMYRTVMDDHFPPEMTISFGDQILVYRKRAWKIPDEKSGELIEKGLRYGENPGQEAALYELVNGNLVLGDCRFIEPGKGLSPPSPRADMIQEGKHPGQDQPDRHRQCPQHHEVPDGKTPGRHCEAQQPLRRGLWGEPGRGL